MPNTPLAGAGTGIYWPVRPPSWYNAGPVKSVCFMPLAFVAGVHGFPMFVSYLAVVLAVVQVARLFRN
jgi:hypothetical protein